MPQTQNSNSANLAFSVESSLGVADPAAFWYNREVNSFNNFGADLKTVARSPISSSRQQQAGSVVDLDASGGWEEDFTPNNFTRLLQGFMYANAHEKVDSSALNPPAVPSVLVGASGTNPVGYGFSSGGAKYLVGNLVFAEGFINPANNGLHAVTSATTNKVGVTPATVDETITAGTANANARVEVCGFQFASGDAVLTIQNDGNGLPLSKRLSTTTQDLTLLGLVPGEWVYLGDDDPNTQFSTINVGWGRIQSITTNQIQFDEDRLLGTTGNGGAGKTIRMFYGKFIRNEPLSVNQITRTYQLERVVGVTDAGSLQTEYITGAAPNTFKLTVPTADKITGEFTFVAKDAEYRSGQTGAANQPKTGTRVAALGQSAFNSTADVMYMRLYIKQTNVDQPPLFAYLESMELNVNNNVSPVKAISKLGAIGFSLGTFAVSISATAFFSDVAAIAAIRSNSPVGINVQIVKANKGVCIDAPRVTVGGGKLNIEKDNPVKLDLTNDAVQSEYGYTLQIGFFPYLPNMATVR